MNRYILLLGGLLLSGLLQAQVPASRNSIRLGIDRTSLDAPDDVGLRYVGRIARHLANDRIVVAAEGGYMRITSQNRLFNDVDPGPNKRERFTADATVLFDLLRSPRQALRLGGGLSAWYGRDDIFRSARVLSAPTGLQGIAINREQNHGLNTGGHVALEYEYLFDPHWGVDVRGRFASLRGAGHSFMLGPGISYRF